MPRPLEKGSTYIPGLDGIRALAVLAVLGFHIGLPQLGGGLLGVSMFFTLSGFLITGILLGSWNTTGGLRLSSFYQRRARRLVPALGVLLLVVLLVTALVNPTALEQRSREGGWAALYVSNWTTITDGTSYFDHFAGPQPLEHLWSLAIEEQFYLVWPVLLLLLLRLGRGRRGLAVRVTTALAAGSFLWMGVLATPGLDHTRVYEGTDTRAGRPAGRGSSHGGPRRRHRHARLGRRLGPRAPAAPVDRGALLRDLPVAHAGRGLDPATGGGAVLGPPCRLPRRADLPAGRPVVAAGGGPHPTARVPRGVHLLGPPPGARWQVGASGRRRPRCRLPPVGRVPGALLRAHAAGLPGRVAPDLGDAPLSPGDGWGPGPRTGSGETRAAATPGSGPSHAPGPRAGQPVRDTGPAAPPRTACTSVVHVGDSTSVGLASSAYLPQARYRMDAQYGGVGVEHVHLDISGARSIVETYHGERNAYEATAARIDAGYEGCWVFAMGTNDTANQYVGGVVPLGERIARVMDEIHGQPALWLTVRTRRSSGPWAELEMQKWNDALRAAAQKYPNMQIYDWAGDARDVWYIADGIHFTSDGYRARAHLIAQALTSAFPASGQESNP